MTRKKMYDGIKKQLEDYQLECDDACMEAVNVAVDHALKYVLAFALDLSSQLVATELYSDAMAAGAVVRKIKALLAEEN